jgi:hypothetical protein
MQKKINLRKIINISLAFLLSVPSMANAMEGDGSKGEKDAGGNLTAQIRAEVDRVLRSFEENMNAYYERTRNPKRIAITPSRETPKEAVQPPKGQTAIEQDRIASLVKAEQDHEIKAKEKAEAIAKETFKDRKAQLELGDPIANNTLLHEGARKKSMELPNMPHPSEEQALEKMRLGEDVTIGQINHNSAAKENFEKGLDSGQLRAWTYLKDLKGIEGIRAQTVLDDYIPLMARFQSLAIFKEPIETEQPTLEEIEEALKFNLLAPGSMSTLWQSGLSGAQLDVWIYLKRNFGTQLSGIPLRRILGRYIPACQRLVEKGDSRPAWERIQIEANKIVPPPQPRGIRGGRGGKQTRSEIPQ